MIGADMYRHGNILCGGYDNHETKMGISALPLLRSDDIPLYACDGIWRAPLTLPGPAAARLLHGYVRAMSAIESATLMDWLRSSTAKIGQDGDLPLPAVNSRWVRYA